MSHFRASPFPDKKKRKKTKGAAIVQDMSGVYLALQVNRNGIKMNKIKPPV